MTNRKRITQQDVQDKFEQHKTDRPVYYNAITHHRNSNGQEMAFDNRKEAAWLYAHIHKFHTVVIQKCSQVGATELLFNLMMWHLQNGRRILFLVPNDTWRTIYVRDRVDGLVKNCPYYKENYSVDPKDPSSATLKSFFGTTVKFAGARNVSNLFSYPCKVIIVDEFDLCNQENLVFADDRTGWKTFEDEEEPFVVKIGNPSIENWGINKEFKKTSQYFWFAICDHCKHEQRLDWQTHFVEPDESRKSGWKLKDEEGNPVCESCKKAFTRRGNGHYKQVNEGKPGSIGIHIDKLRWDVSKNAIKTLFTKWEEAQTSIVAMENFYNQHLGLPYENGEHRVTKSMIIDCSTGSNDFVSMDKLRGEVYEADDGKSHRRAASSRWTIVAGVDQGHGKGNHMHISAIDDSGTRHKYWIGRCYSLAEIEQKLDDYQVSVCVMDAQGGAIGYNELRSLIQRRNGQLYLCRYRPKDDPKHTYILDEETGTVLANRTELMDGVFDSYKHHKVVLPQSSLFIDDGEFVNQMTEPVRTKEVDKNNVIQGNWKNSGPDDHFHADVYELLAFKLAGYDHIEESEELTDDKVIDDDDDSSSWVVL